MRTTKSVSLCAVLVTGFLLLSGCSVSSSPDPQAQAKNSSDRTEAELSALVPAPALFSSDYSRNVAIPTSNSSEIELAYNGSFFLRAGEAVMRVPSQFATGEPALEPHVEFNLTLIEDPAAPPDSFSTLLATIIWPTNRTGSTVEQWLYSYTPKNGFSLLWNLAKEQPVITSRQLDGHTLEISLPNYGRVQKFQLKEEDILRVNSNSPVDDPLNQPDLIQLGTPFAYSITGTAPAPAASWIVKRIINLESSPFHAGNLYTMYQVQDHKVTAETSYLSSSADPAEAELLDLVLIRHKKLPVEPAELRAVLTDTTSGDIDQMLMALQHLVNEEILHESDGFYTI